MDRLSLVSAVAAIAGAAVGIVSPATAQVAWKSGEEKTVVAMGADQVRISLKKLAARPDESRVVLEFSRPIAPPERDALAAAGIQLLSYLSGNAYFASLAANLNVRAAMAAAPISGVRAIDLAWKIDPLLNEVPRDAIVAIQSPDDESVSIDNPIIGVYVQLHADRVADDAAVAMAEAHGGVVKNVLVSIPVLVVELPFNNIRGLAAESDVQWVEAPIVMGPVNNSNRARVGAETVWQPPYGLDGTGVKAFIYDAGKVTQHQDYQNRMTILPSDTSGAIDHATHVSGTVGGNDTNGPYSGMAPNVTMVSAGFQWGGGDGFLYNDPGDIEADFTAAIAQYQVEVSNSSIGNNTEPNGFDCARQGNYGITDQLIDSIARGSISGGVPFRLVWANGNERQGSRCNVEGFGSYYSVAPPAGAKNHLAIGALNSNDDSVTSFTSWGPTDDGRMKPDFSAPGCQSNEDFGVTSTVGTGSYASFCGTSMASPTVCGLSCLVLEEWHTNFPGLPNPRNSTLKVLFAHNALDVRQPGPDYETGYGSARIQPTIDFLRTFQFTEQELAHGGTHFFNVDVDPGDPFFKVTLAWDDPPGTPNVNPALVNNLDVVAVDPNGNSHFAWTLNPQNPGANATTGLNTRDNLEQVYVAAPAAGTWRVEVRGTNIPQGPQVYSIAGAGTPDVNLISIALPQGVPTLLLPGQSATIAVEILTINETIVPGTALFHYRMNGGAFTSVELTHLGGDDYEATLPGPDCGDLPEFYFSVVGSESGQVQTPSGGENAPFQVGVGDYIDLYAADFEANADGWVVGAGDDNATTGIWTRVDPIGTQSNGQFVNPENDNTVDPGTMAFVTGQGTQGGNLGENDVDTGKTTLSSPVLDLSSNPEGRISYYRWYHNSVQLSNDVFKVEVSNDGSNWVPVEAIGPTGEGCSGGWIFHQFRVADFVSQTANVRVRFVARDDSPPSIVEAGVDDLLVEYVGCVPDCIADFDGNGQLNVFDFLEFQTAFANEEDRADLAPPFGVLNVFDFLQFQTLFAEGC